MGEVGGGVALDEGATERCFRRKVVEEGALGRFRGREHRIHGGCSEAALQDERLGGVQDPVAGGGSIPWHL